MKHLASRVAGLALSLFASVALAQGAPDPEPGFFKPPADDTSVGFLREIFGAVVDAVMTGSNSDQAQDTALAAGFAVFGMGVLALSMLFVIYTTIKGAVDTAHDGEFLGKKLKAPWVIMRTAAGTAFLLPLKSGFSLVQIAVLWIAIHGVGLADKVWISMADYIGETGMIGRPNIPNSRPLAASILRYEVCAAAMNKQYAAENRPERISAQKSTSYVMNSGEVARAGNIFGGPVGMIQMGLDGIAGSYSVNTYSWDATGGYINKKSICGALTWQESEQSAESNGNRHVHKTQILKAQSDAVQNMINALRPVAEAIVKGEKPRPGALESTAEAYESAIRNAAAQAVKEANNARESDFVEHAKEGGWLFSGTYYNQIINLNDAVQSAVNAMPESAAATIKDKEAEATLITYEDALVTANEYIRNGSKSPQRAYEQASEADWQIPTSWDEAKRMLNVPMLGAINQMTQEIAGANTSHIAQMKSVGDTVMASAWALLGTNFILRGFGGGIADDVLTVGTFDAGSALESIGGLMTSAVMMLLAAGAYLSFYVSMIPYITWIAGIIKWLTVVVESVIAAPIWAAAHVHPDGDEQVGRAGPGYMLILSLFLRPTLMVFGLVLSIIMAQPAAHFVNLTYITQVQGAMGNSANFLPAMIAYTVIYGLIMSIVLHAIFSLIHFVPDQVPRWIGHAMNVSGMADGEAREVEHRTLGVFGGVSRGLGGGHGGKAPRPGKAPAGDGAGAPKPEAANEQHTTSVTGPSE